MRGSIDLLRCDVKLSETVNFCDTIEEENEETRDSPKEQLKRKIAKRINSKKTRNCLNFTNNRSLRKCYTSQGQSYY